MRIVQTIRAVIRNPIPYGAAHARETAPRGEYLVENRESCVDLCECDGGCAFTLSFDAFQQHVVEGRIAVVG